MRLGGIQNNCHQVLLMICIQSPGIYKIVNVCKLLHRLEPMKLLLILLGSLFQLLLKIFQKNKKLFSITKNSNFKVINKSLNKFF